MPDYYDPAARLADDLATALKDKFNLSRNPAVYFDGRYFMINNASVEDAPAGSVQSAANQLGFTNIDTKKEGFYQFCISSQWIESAVAQFPEFACGSLNTAEHALATRMQAHIAFDFCGAWTPQVRAAALLLFKVIHTNSARIRQQTGGRFMGAIEDCLREGHLPIEMLKAVIHAVHMLNTYHRGFL